MRCWFLALPLAFPLALAAATPACGNVSDPNAPDAAGAASFSLTVLDADPVVPLDGAARITVQIAREGGFAGAVSIAGASLPSGVAVQEATIAADATTADVIVSGAAPLVIGAKVSFELAATGEGAPARNAALTDVPVTGAPGSLDLSFGAGGGLGTVSFGNDDGGTLDAIHVANGKIYATGYGVGGLGAIGIRTIRFVADGARDAEWNGGAMQREQLGSGTGDLARGQAVAPQADGRPIIIARARNSQVPGGYNLGVVRYSVTGGNGGSDFGAGNGKGTVDLGGEEIVAGGTVLANSSIVAIGQRDNHFLISRLTSIGQLDTTFAAPAGYERLVRGDASTAHAVTVDAQGRILVAGTQVTSNVYSAFLVRYRDDGVHDGTFGTAGEVTVTSTASEQAVAVRVTGDAVYLATEAKVAGATSFRVRRYSATGELDASFGTGGVAEVAVDAASAKDMVVLGSGAVLFLGEKAGEAYLVRLTRGGQVDTLFGGNGDGAATIYVGDNGAIGALATYGAHQVVFSGSNEGGVPGPGTNGVVGRVWM